MVREVCSKRRGDSEDRHAIQRRDAGAGSSSRIAIPERQSTRVDPTPRRGDLAQNPAGYVYPGTALAGGSPARKLSFSPGLQIWGSRLARSRKARGYHGTPDLCKVKPAPAAECAEKPHPVCRPTLSTQFRRRR